MDPGAAVGVDVGGTFTDVMLVADGTVTTVKTPTTADPSGGVLAGIETACDRAGVDPAAVSHFRHATTTAVNALLEGSGATTALVTTEGFGDVLSIRRQTRPALYDLDASPPAPLVSRERRYELDERTTVEDRERAVDPDAVRALAAEIDADAVAVCLLHAYADPRNERRVASILREELDVPIAASHEVLATFREYERTATTVVDAYVAPVVGSYLDRLADAARERGLPAPTVMQSNGGIARADRVAERPVQTVLSGPAAGVIGAAAVVDADGPVLTLDMGGTSTDVSLVRGDGATTTTEADIAGHPVRIPMVDIETVGAGGGSIGWVDAGGALRVGPESAGADPGPAAYGQGGTAPTLTDAALALGHLGDGTTLGAGDGLSLDADRARAVLASLATDAGLSGAEAAATGIYRVTTARMARAVRRVSTARGHDVRTLSLVAYGGAGPMVAAALAGRLGLSRVSVPRASGVLSAFGLLAADERHDAVRTRRTALASADTDEVEAAFAALAETVRERTSHPAMATIERAAACRYAGQAYELEVAVETPFEAERLRERFHDTHATTHGYRMDEPVEMVTLRATATVPREPPALTHAGTSIDDAVVSERPVSFAGTDAPIASTPVYEWSCLPASATFDGPAVVEGGESTVVVPPSWTVTVDDRGTLRLDAPAGVDPG